MITLLRRLGADRSGASAIEFALIFPILFMIHIGAAEALQAFVAQRKVSHIAATMADITARNRVVTTADMNDILGASVAMMYPFPTTRLQQRVSSMSADNNGSVKTDWSSSKDYKDLNSPAMPSGYLRPNESVILTEVIYNYEPTFGIFLSDDIRMSRHAYVRPRLSAKVEKTD
ncbi:TadE/TadG family type IV pilus assembly protein [Phenylobacterium sp.]|uniref:TadE/TadG family type IV pilus assembly protein n=1 Tax=Phenylobacterium sp. TaxID=1871053 RepID=UPI002601552C|nr:TadE/TadG family type IV pilus assembly protein [Phenylobacterium sp.]